ncbi:type I methionyl aminopeptidase [Candidatus Uhrbacteria bacterium RIFCSPLOWO2_02_FULL_48_12]|uniref:Methionine aminopeptidase n=1 Tax=Candidatus Uhrbacteria bacterium RIFCSPLOWO2_02_FULL_48_12 TaxID=1802407 RepID=A0A1F7VB01_9BACT|nr:MAG: type I methionyl aminopeptidase [Candidatus Uhrbacteria bacterium RIFCSPLOWO2_02_FULL_48_12]
MIYNSEEIAILREGGQKLAQVLREVAGQIRPGVTTAELDALAEKQIKNFGGAPSFLGYMGNLAATPFPSTLCTSINGEVVHAPAVPARTLKDGDIIGLDIGMRYPSKSGLCTDMAVTVGVGKIFKEAANLIRVTKEALDLGTSKARAGVCVRDIGEAIQRHVEAAGYSVVRDLTGHGVGRAVHEEPEIPNFAVPGPIGDRRLEAGMVIAIEPMVNAGSVAVKTKHDHWTVETHDRSLSAHFEHTVAVTKNGPLVLTLP